MNFKKINKYLLEDLKDANVTIKEIKTIENKKIVDYKFFWDLNFLFVVWLEKNNLNSEVYELYDC